MLQIRIETINYGKSEEKQNSYQAQYFQNILKNNSVWKTIWNYLENFLPFPLKKGVNDYFNVLHTCLIYKNESWAK